MSTKLIVLACLVAAANARSIDNITHYLSTISSRIVGGHDARPGEFPHQVSLQLKFPEHGISEYIHFCGGSILREEWILTAAHCLVLFDDAYYGVSFIVKAGKHKLNSIESSEQRSYVDKVFIYEGFDLNSQVGISPHDIGLIKLKNPLKLNIRVAAIGLPKRDSEPTGKVTLSGWGSVSSEIPFEMPQVLQTVDFEIIDRETCNKAIHDLYERAGQPLHYDLVHETNICTGPLTGGRASCAGDSGGPLISRSSFGKTEVVGIVSWGIYPCGTKGAPSVYTRTSAYIDWIEHTMFGPDIYPDDKQ